MPAEYTVRDARRLAEHKRAVERLSEDLATQATGDGRGRSDALAPKFREALEAANTLGGKLREIEAAAPPPVL